MRVSLKQRIVRRAPVLALGVVLAVLCAGGARADDICRPPLTGQQRYGYVATSANWPVTFDIAQVNAGWAPNQVWNTIFPTGMDRALLIRTYPGYKIDRAQLGVVVDANPGATWLIGNEPDCLWQDNVLAEEYARIYYDLYTFLKNRDAMSQVAPGGIVQPTPIRLAYLDRVLDAYLARYHHSLPADVWHIHNAILNEVNCEYMPDNCWGSGVPPGFDVAHGEIRDFQENDNLVIFQQQLWDFRQWMFDRGYGSVPLLVTEYGVLMPELLGFTVPRVNQFMSGTFDFMTTATDPLLGDPADGFRLVQRWAWFSLDVPPYSQENPTGFNGNLFNPDTAEITSFGLNYASYSASLPPSPYVDLGLSTWALPRATEELTAGQEITYTVRARIANAGTADAGPFFVDLAWTGPTNGSLREPAANLPAHSTQWLAFDLPGIRSGRYTLALDLDPTDAVGEAAECNNHHERSFTVPTPVTYLPLVFHFSNRSPTTANVRDGEQARQNATVAVSLSGAFARAVARARMQPPLGFEEFTLPTASSHPAQIAIDPTSGWLWVTERDGNKIASFDPVRAEWQEFPVAIPGSQPWGITVDSASDVWVAAPGANKILRLTPSTGVIVEYSVPTPGSQPWGIAVDGGLVWFTEQAGNKVARLNPTSGQVVEYDMPLPDLGLSDIAAQGGTIWFSAPDADRFGRLIASTGQINTQLRPAGSTPRDVVLKSNGVPWFSEPGGNRVILFIPSTLTVGIIVDAVTPNAEPFGIALDADEDVWFTERAANKLAWFDKLRRIPFEYRLPTPASQPTDIVVDAGGCAWYTAPGINAIGRFCRPPTQLSYLPLVAKGAAGE